VSVCDATSPGALSGNARRHEEEEDEDRPAAAAAASNSAELIIVRDEHPASDFMIRIEGKRTDRSQ